MVEVRHPSTHRVPTKYVAKVFVLSVWKCCSSRAVAETSMLCQWRQALALIWLSKPSCVAAAFIAAESRRDVSWLCQEGHT